MYVKVKQSVNKNNNKKQNKTKTTKQNKTQKQNTAKTQMIDWFIVHYAHLLFHVASAHFTKHK